MNIKLKHVMLSALLGLSGFTMNAEKVTLLTDIHITPGNHREEKLKQVIADINSNDTELVILSGDLSDEGSDEQLKNVKSFLDLIKKPLYVLPGNHENNWSQSACKTFFDIWGNDRFVTETENLVIVGINCGPYMKMGDGHVKHEDLLWLDKTLAERTKSGKKVLSVCHYALNADLDSYRQYVEILKKYPVVGHLNGHYHQYKNYRVENIEVLYCRSLEMGKKNPNFGYSIVDITADSVKVFEKVLDTPMELKFKYEIDHNTMTALQEPENLDTEVPANFSIELAHRDDASIFTRIGIDKNNLYFGNSLGYVKSVSKSTGKINWAYKTSAGLFSRPVVTDKYIIVPSADKRLIWLNKENGSFVKEKTANGPYVADGIVVGNILYQGGYKVFQAWDINSGELKWELNDLDNYCQAAPAYLNNKIAFGAWDTYLRKVDMKTGNLDWKWNNGKMRNMLGPGNCVPVIANGKVIVVAPDRYMTAIDWETGEQIWRNNSHKYRESLGRSVDGKKVYAKTMDGEIVSISTEGSEFNELWITDAGLGYDHAPCIVLEHNGVVYAGSRRGIIVAIDAKTTKLLWRKQVGASEINGFEVDNKGNVYASLVEGSVWKISKK